MSIWSSPYVWFDRVENPKKAVLIVHGLNTKPEKMNDLANMLFKNSYVVLNYALSGHRGNYNEMKKVTRKKWLNEILSAYKIIKKKYPKLPVYYIGFSLGGVLAIDALTRNSFNFDIKKMALFVPAIKIRSIGYFIYFMRIFGRTVWVPSFSPREYRANKWLSFNIYIALFKSIEAVNNVSNISKYINIPTIIFIDKKDELVSITKTKKFIKNNSLSKWKIIEVKSKQFYKHLIIDKKSLGDLQWIEVSNKINKIFN